MIEDPDRLFASRYNQWIPEHGVGLGLHAEASALGAKDGGRPAADRPNFCRWRTHNESTMNVHSRFCMCPATAMGIWPCTTRATKPFSSAMPCTDATAPRRPVNRRFHLAITRSLHTWVHYKCCTRFDIDWIYSGHWPTYHGSQVSEFLTESRRFVDNAAALVWKTLEKHPEGVTCGASWMNVGRL